VKKERKKSKMDRFFREVLELGCGTYISELLHMGIRVFMIQAIKWL
jgi:hypothetical protein